MTFRRLLSAFLFLFTATAARAEQVVFSELMYAPPAGKPEFIEVWNITATPLDMAKWKFSNGINFTLPDFNAGAASDHILKPFERILVSAATPAATRTAYPTIPSGARIFGPWTGSLANEGERVTLEDKNAVIVCTVEYGDAGRWPIAPDGAGHSLVLANENKVIDDWRVWRASTQNGGSPGNADPALPATGITLNEVHFGATGRVDWIEVRNDSMTTTMVASGLYVASKNDFSDKVQLSGSITPGAVASINVDFAANSDGEVKLYLVDGNNHVRDAIKITKKVGRDCWEKFPAGSKEWFNGTAATPDPQNNPARNTAIVINEIMADPPSNQRDGEFVELYNRSGDPVNVGGWKLKEGVTFTIPAGTVIQPGGYLVIGANSAWLNANYTGLGAIGNWDGQLANGGEMLKLDDENGNLVNAVDYRFGGEWPELAAGNGSSLELANPNSDNSIGGAWRDSDESQKSSFQSFSIDGGRYTRTPVGNPSTIDDEVRIWAVGDAHLVLKDIVLRPTQGGANIFVNPAVTTKNDNNLDGWQSRGTHADTFHDAEGIHLVADGHGDNKVNHMEKDAAGMSGNTNYTLTFQARWVYGKPRLVTQTWDLSWGGTTLIPIPSNLGSPGAANSRLQANPAPQVTGLRHSPAVPIQGQTVTVTARVSSTTPVQTVQVFHRLDNVTPNPTWNVSAMNDAGTGGDAVANDGIYTAQINPVLFTGYNSGIAVNEFYVRVTASNGAIAELPRRGAAGPGLWAIGTPGPGGATDLRRMRIVMSAYWLNALDQTTTNTTGGHTSTYDYKYPLHSARYFPCTFIHNDSEIFYDSKCRKTGSPFTRQRDSNLVRGRVVLPGDKPLRGKTKMYWDNDGTDTRLHNRVVRYWLYLMGVPGNENEICRVTRNGAGYTVRETSEVFDKEMLDRIWENGSDGTFYELDDRFWIADDGATKVADQNATWAYKSNDSQGAENPTAYHNNFVPKSREPEYDYSGIIEWTRQLSTNPNLSFDLLEKMADSRTMAAYAAVRGYASDWDTLTGSRGKNGYMYQRSTDRKWTFLHWDSDLAFQTSHLSDSPIGNLANIPTYFNRPFIRRQVNYFLTEMLNAYNANGPRMNAWLDAEENASDAYVANKATYQMWSTNRAGAIQTYIGSALTAQFAAASPAPNSSTPLSVIDVSGTAPSSGFRVECVGQPQATLTWITDASWKLSGIILKEGVNNLTFRMLDMFGAPIDPVVNYSITKTGNSAPIPALTSSPASGNVALGQILTVDAAGSFDPEAAGPLSYAWTVSPSVGVTISSPSDSKRNFVFHQPGSYTVTLQVTDANAQTASINRVFSVYSTQDFDSFLGEYLVGFDVINAELRDNYSPSAWYSLNETEGQLVVQVLDTAMRPLTPTAQTFPLLTKPLPATSDFVLQTDFSFETRQFGFFQAGLYLETQESGVKVQYFLSMENGTTFKVLRSFNNGGFIQLGLASYTGGPITVRILRLPTSIQFQRLVNGVWFNIATQNTAVTAVKGGVFVAAGNTGVVPPLPQSVRVAFDYLLLGNPGHISDLVSNLRLSEIMYNPASGGVEFLELQNIGTTPLDLTGAYFEASLPWNEQFTFPNLVLQPGQFCAVTNDVPGFVARYGSSVTVLGPAVGGLANDTERILLKDAAANTVFDFTYVDSWHPVTDGGGRSLDTRTTDLTLYNGATAWRPSYVNGGSVGYVDIPAAVDSDPGGTAVNPGQPINLQVTFSGVPTPSLQWRKDGEPIPGATAPTYHVDSATEDHEGVYDVFVQNNAGNDTSLPALVTVNDPVTFNPHPASQAVNPGSNATLSPGVLGTGPFSYQWRKDGGNLDGKTEPTLVVAGIEANEGSYDVIVTNVVGSATSNPAILTVNDPVIITKHPENQIVNPGELAKFSVTATGTGPFSYVWKKDGDPIPDQTEADLEFNAQEGDEGVYTVVVTGAAGPVPSDEATLSVNDPVEITDQPNNVAMNFGQPFVLSVSATGTEPISYQWFKGNQPIDGATASKYQVGAATSADTGAYHVVVLNPVGPKTSETVQVMVNLPVQVTADPAPQVVLVGGRASFRVEVAGTGPFNYQWRKNEAPIVGANGDTYEIPSVGSQHVGLYDVLITNSAGSDMSAKAALSLLDWKLAAGTYQGALHGPDLTAPGTNPRPGRVTVLIGKTGKFTGTLEYFGLKHAFRGSFDLQLKSSVEVARRGLNAVILDLSLDGATQQLNATTRHKFPPSLDYAGELPFIPKRTRTAPSPLAGRYTMLLRPGLGAPSDFSAPGMASIKVATSGSVSWTGKLPDSIGIKGNAWLTRPIRIPLLPALCAEGPFTGRLQARALADGGGGSSWRPRPANRSILQVS